MQLLSFRTRLDTQAMMVPRANRYEIGVWRWSNALTEVIPTPAHDGTISLERDTMGAAHRNRYKIGVWRWNLDPSIIVNAIEKGINYFDTSEGYGKGGAERNLGRAIKNYRDRVHVTTKIGSV